MTELEQRVVECAMERLKEWEFSNPDGLIPMGEPGAMQTTAGHELIAACIELKKQRTDAASHPQPKGE